MPSFVHSNSTTVLIFDTKFKEKPKLPGKPQNKLLSSLAIIPCGRVNDQGQAPEVLMTGQGLRLAVDIPRTTTFLDSQIQGKHIETFRQLAS